tara:strand:- start:5 stop:718 length:714 start_codon:yes stop_codon:yes gene_type:complete
MRQLWLQIYFNYQIILKDLLNRIKIVFSLLKIGSFKPIIESISTRLYSTKNFVGLEVKINQLKNLDSKINITIRPFEQSDINSLKEGQRHIRLVEKKIPDCYVAAIQNNVPVYRQWLFTQEQFEAIIDYFGQIFPEIGKDEAIIEGVFTHLDYRGLRIMPNAIYQILNQNHYSHLKRAIAFVEQNNVGSLKGFYRLGFEPYILRQEKWLFFARKISFIPLPSEIYESYLQLNSPASN